MKRRNQHISLKDIEKFKVLYQKHYGMKLNDQEALGLFNRFVAFISYIIKK